MKDCATMISYHRNENVIMFTAKTIVKVKTTTECIYHNVKNITRIKTRQKKTSHYVLNKSQTN